MIDDIHRPRIPPAPEKPAHIPIARGRSSGGNEVVITDRVTGITMAAPAPASARAAIMNPTEVANAAPRVAMKNTASPLSSTGRRPQRSPTAPIGMSNAARVSV